MNYKSIIQSVLYVAGSNGIELTDLKKIIEIPTDEIKTIIKEMIEELNDNPDAGITIKNHGSYYHMFTKPENKESIIKLMGIQKKNPLTPTLMEVLAIIAYNKSCTSSKIEEIRGVDCTAAIAKLVELNLIQQSGRAETPGRPILYDVTQKFFNLFGIKSLSELPKIKEINSFSFDDGNFDFFNVNRFNDEE